MKTARIETMASIAGTTSRIGMKALAALWVALVLPATAPAEAALTGCSTAIPLDLSGPRPKLTFALANGRSGVALFDTGSRGALAERRQAERLGLVDEGPVGPGFDAHGGADAYRSTLRGLSIGGLALGDVPISVFQTGLPGIDLVLGPQTFPGRLVELDLSKATLKICATAENLPELGDSTPYNGEDFPLPAIPIVVGGRTLLATMDTGSPLPLSLPTALAGTLPLDGSLVRAGTARGHAGESAVFKARVDGVVRIGPVVLESPEVLFTDLLPGPNVGTAVLRRFVITIDATGQRTWIRSGTS